jgi:hypothetical protein
MQAKRALLAKLVANVGLGKDRGKVSFTFPLSCAGFLYSTPGGFCTRSSTIEYGSTAEQAQVASTLLHHLPSRANLLERHISHKQASGARASVLQWLKHSPWRSHVHLSAAAKHFPSAPEHFGSYAIPFERLTCFLSQPQPSPAR